MLLWGIGDEDAAAVGWEERVHALGRCLSGAIRSVSRDVLGAVGYWRKRLDLWGNDYYLAHIYRTMRWRLRPTHVVVLGDLIGSQWVSDAEFELRGERFWNRVFAGGRRVEDKISAERGAMEVLGWDEEWRDRVVNVLGNHDAGYAGDMTKGKVERFERMFGRANWERRFRLEVPMVREEEGRPVPELRLVVLNSLNLDAPVLEPGLQEETYGFINEVIATASPVGDETSATILLTHLPLYKDDGVCTDGPKFEYYDDVYGGGIREQNHLSYDASKNILEGYFGMNGKIDATGQRYGRNGIILTGHDHEGCDVTHTLDGTGDNSRWIAENRTRYAETRRMEESSRIREITVRSMMGDFGGNAGLLSAWWDFEKRTWRFEYATCNLGKQHFWWAVHVLDVVTVVLLIYTGWSLVREANSGGSAVVIAAREKKSQ